MGDILDTLIKLKLVGQNKYALFGPEGNQIGTTYRGPKNKAIEWAIKFCSSWQSWVVDYEELDDEAENGVF